LSNVVQTYVNLDVIICL